MLNSDNRRLFTSLALISTSCGEAAVFSTIGELCRLRIRVDTRAFDCA